MLWIIPRWLVRREYFVLVRDLRLPLLDVPRHTPMRWTTLTEGQIPALSAINPVMSGAEVRRRWAEGQECFLCWVEGSLAHYWWETTRPNYLPYLGKTLLPLEGDIIVSNVFTAPRFRGRGIYSASCIMGFRRLRDKGFTRSIGVAAWWNAPALQVHCQKGGYTLAGRVGYWNLGLWKHYFVLGDVCLDQRGLSVPEMRDMTWSQSASARCRKGYPMSPERDCPTYASFWNAMGADFPSLKGAASTEYYFECERTLYKQFYPDLKGRLLLKTDLWNEAKNTEILLWAAEQGTRPVGIDIAFDVVQQAMKVLDKKRPGFVVSDVRSLPFPADTFDLIYSMGTIEHFPNYEVAVREIFRVLKPSGRAIIGVPNKLDPFFRPLVVLLLNKVGLYAYGIEKSFTPRALRRLVESAGFRVTAQTGLLFMPGLLRMVDLWCHIRFPRLAPLTGRLVRPFAWLYRRFPWLRRHGYLIACVVEKPES